uniref:Uncharacterized protein n=1 Tax=Glossina brevipalpis TaxID=37001 RepID=A0A1A9WBX9_9MUSC
MGRMETILLISLLSEWFLSEDNVELVTGLQLSCLQEKDTSLLSVDDKSKQTVSKSLHIQQNLHLNYSTSNIPVISLKKSLAEVDKTAEFGTEPKEITNRISVKTIETKFKNTTDNSVQITDKTGFRTANGKDISLSKEGKKRLEGLLKELNESASAEDSLLDIKNQIISKKNNPLSQKKNN